LLSFKNLTHWTQLYMKTEPKTIRNFSKKILFLLKMLKEKLLPDVWVCIRTRGPNKVGTTTWWLPEPLEPGFVFVKHLNKFMSL
jgi:hypothetical protein